MINEFSVIQEVANKMQNGKTRNSFQDQTKFAIAKRNVLDRIEEIIDKNKEIIIDEYKEMAEAESDDGNKT